MNDWLIDRELFFEVNLFGFFAYEPRTEWKVVSYIMTTGVMPADEKMCGCQDFSIVELVKILGRLYLGG